MITEPKDQALTLSDIKTLESLFIVEMHAAERIFRLVENGMADIKPQFKVGDKVRVRPNDTHSHFVKQYDNCIGKIVGEHHEYFVVIVTGAFQDQFLAEELQLIEETTGQDVTFQEGNKPQGKRILAECKWSDDGDPYYDVLHWHPTSGLKYPEGWYDQGGENVPDNVIKRFAEF